MLSGVESIFTIFIMIFMGYYLAKRGMLTSETSGVFSRLVFDITMPMLMVTSIYERFTREVIQSSYNGISIALVSIVAGYVVGDIVFKFAGRIKNRSIYSIMFSFSNTIFIGLPVCISVLGEEAAAYALLYYFANTTLFWTIGIYRIKKEKGLDLNGIEESKLRRIFSPPFAGFIAGIILVFLKFEIPVAIYRSLEYIGGMTIPLSMLIVGIMIFNIVSDQRGRLSMTGIIVLLGKFALLPLITISLVYNAGIPLLMKKAFVLQSAMPVMAQSAIVARKYEIEQENASYIMSLSTVLSMAVIPVYIVMINWMWPI